jgi:hypothetical protein
VNRTDCWAQRLLQPIKGRDLSIITTDVVKQVQQLGQGTFESNSGISTTRPRSGSEKSKERSPLAARVSEHEALGSNEGHRWAARWNTHSNENHNQHQPEKGDISKES